MQIRKINNDCKNKFNEANNKALRSQMTIDPLLAYTGSCNKLLDKQTYRLY